MKKTAVEYIKDKLMCDEYWYENMTFEQIFEQAKEMEKEQMISFYNEGSFAQIRYFAEGKEYIYGRQYYNEKFKQK
jgi:hypothetical protein